MSPALQLDGVGLRFGTGVERLADVAFLLAPGTAATLAGPAGSGKTLLTEVAALARRPDRGSVRLFGQESVAADPGRLAGLRRRVGWAESAPALHHRLDPVTDAALPLLVAGTGETEARQQATQMLDWLAGEPGTGCRNCPELAHRVALARAVLGSPELVLVDELGGMAERLRARLATLTDGLRRQGVAFLFMSRDAGLLATIPAATRGHLSAGRLYTDTGPAR